LSDCVEAASRRFCGLTFLTQLGNIINDVKMRTTIDISDATLAELRRRARANNQSFRQTVEATLQSGLASQPTAPRSARKLELNTFNVGMKKAYRGVSLNQIYDQLEADEHQRVAER